MVVVDVVVVVAVVVDVVDIAVVVVVAADPALERLPLGVEPVTSWSSSPSSIVADSASCENCSKSNSSPRGRGPVETRSSDFGTENFSGWRQQKKQIVKLGQQGERL